MEEPFSIQEDPPPKERGEDQCIGLCEEDSEDVEFGCVLKPALLGFLVVLCGTASTITGKLQYGVHAYGRSSCGTHLDDDAVDDDDHTQTHRCLFEKPWFQTFVMYALRARAFERQRARERQNRRAPPRAPTPSFLILPSPPPLPPRCAPAPPARAGSSR